MNMSEAIWPFSRLIVQDELFGCRFLDLTGEQECLFIQNGTKSWFSWPQNIANVALIGILIFFLPFLDLDLWAITRLNTEANQPWTDGVKWYPGPQSLGGYEAIRRGDKTLAECDRTQFPNNLAWKRSSGELIALTLRLSLVTFQSVGVENVPCRDTETASAFS